MAKEKPAPAPKNFYLSRAYVHAESVDTSALPEPDVNGRRFDFFESKEIRDAGTEQNPAQTLASFTADLTGLPDAVFLQLAAIGLNVTINSVCNDAVHLTADQAAEAAAKRYQELLDGKVKSETAARASTFHIDLAAALTKETGDEFSPDQAKELDDVKLAEFGGKDAPAYKKWRGEVTAWKVFKAVKIERQRKENAAAPSEIPAGLL
jgi:hypothetical protein